MKAMTAADFFLHMPFEKRKSVMLKVAKEATEMQRKILRKAEGIRGKKRKK